MVEKRGQLLKKTAFYFILDLFLSVLFLNKRFNAATVQNIHDILGQWLRLCCDAGAFVGHFSCGHVNAHLIAACNFFAYSGQTINGTPRLIALR